MITYFIKSGLCLALLLAFYHLVLEREKMHTFNRFFLLGSVLFSFVAPLYVIYEYVPVVTETFAPTMITDSGLVTAEIVEEEPFNYTPYLIGLYVLISSLLFIRFCKNLFLIILKIRKNRRLQLENATIVLVEDAISPHTFLNYIFINKDEYFSEKVENELFTHELTHVTQKHTLDILLIEFLQVLFWINPTFILLKKAIKLNHEFLADNKVISTYKNTTEYQYLLLNRATWNKEYYLASNLNYLLTKKRLEMMTKQSSRTLILLKKLAVIPLLVGFVFLFAERAVAYENINENITKNSDANKNFEADFEKSKNSKTESSFQKISDFNSDGKFSISVEKDNNFLRLRCYDCRWADLKLDLNKKFIINDFGFSNGKTLDRDIFAFEIEATKNNVILKSLKGTTWKSLKFDLTKEKKHYLNQKGSIKTERKKFENKESSKQSISYSKKTEPKEETSRGKWVVDNAIVVEEIQETKPEKGWLYTNNQTIFYVKQGNKIKYYNRWGNRVDKNGKKLKKAEPKEKTSKGKWDVDSEVIVEDVQKIKPKTGWITINNSTHYYIEYPNGKTKYYNRWGNQVDKTGKIIKPLQPFTQKRDNNFKTGFIKVNGQNIFYVKDKNKGKTRYFNREGQQVDKNGKIVNPEQTKSDEVIPGQNITYIYNENKVAVKFKRNNLPEEKEIKGVVPPPPPMPISPLDFMKEQKDNNADYFYNEKKINYKKAIELLKTKRPVQIKSEKVNGKTIVNLTKRIQENIFSLDSIPSKTGLEQVGNKVYAYKITNGKKQYFDEKSGKPVSVKHPEPEDYDEMMKRIKKTKKICYIENKRVSEKEFKNTVKNDKSYHLFMTSKKDDKNTVVMIASKKDFDKEELLKKYR